MSEDMIARAEHDTAVEAARKEGVTAERARIKAILDLPEAKGREGSAMHLAFTTDLTAEVASGVLSGLAASAAPEAEQEQQPSGLRASDTQGGLVPFDPSADKKQTSVEKAKASWGNVTDKLNARM